MSESMMAKISVLCQRRRREITLAGYIFVIGACLLFIIDPVAVGTATKKTNKAKSWSRVKFTPYSYFKPRPSGQTLKKVIELPFVPRDYSCESMFEGNTEFEYPETYIDHADAFKAALMMNNLVREGVATEFSWLLMSIGALPFVRTACETHFNSGHNAFHLLTSQDDLIVHSFAPNMDNYTQDMADFMAIEFPDRFFLHKGDPIKSIADFSKKQGNTTKCDLIFIECNQNEDIIKQQLEMFHKISHPVENLVMMNTHPRLGNIDVVALWENAVKEKNIEENFRCSFPEDNDIALPKNQQGYLVGSYSKYNTTV